MIRKERAGRSEFEVPEFCDSPGCRVYLFRSSVYFDEGEEEYQFTEDIEGLED